jgi:hypothetical protein
VPDADEIWAERRGRDPSSSILESKAHRCAVMHRTPAWLNSLQAAATSTLEHGGTLRLADAAAGSAQMPGEGS